MTSSPSNSAVNDAVKALNDAKDRFARTPITRRIELLTQCMDGIMAHASEWLEEACKGKGIPAGSPFRAEELASGPFATLRFLQLMRINLEHLQNHSSLRLPGKVTPRENGQLHVTVTPEAKMFDRWIFSHFQADVRLLPGTDWEGLQERMVAREQDGAVKEGHVCLILGAGNISSIPATDTLSKLFLEKECVLLKMNPVNEYLGKVFEKAFAPLIDEGCLRLVYGGPEVGAAGINHSLVDSVHITGSNASHDAIVWGGDPEERRQRMARNEPLLDKEISSELGNVTSWIVVPGPFTKKELDFQSDSVASSLVNNASFNCVATKVILTWRGWDQRQAFMDRLESILDATQPRHAYYPGAVERFKRFAPDVDLEDGAKALPWTLLRDLDPETAKPHHLEEESFVCVCIEVVLDADSESEFLKEATRFANEELWGTLAIGLTVHPNFRKDPVNERAYQECLDQLEYGVISVNHWAGLAFAMMGIPWGGYPGRPLDDIQSGMGWVHNAYMLDGIEKSVLEGPLTVFPKPIWVPTHKNPEPTAWRLLELYRRPTRWNLIKVIATALFS